VTPQTNSYSFGHLKIGALILIPPLPPLKFIQCEYGPVCVTFLLPAMLEIFKPADHRSLVGHDKEVTTEI